MVGHTEMRANAWPGLGLNVAVAVTSTEASPVCRVETLTLGRFAVISEAYAAGAVPYAATLTSIATVTTRATIARCGRKVMMFLHYAQPSEAAGAHMVRNRRAVAVRLRPDFSATTTGGL